MTTIWTVERAREYTSALMAIKFAIRHNLPAAYRRASEMLRKE